MATVNSSNTVKRMLLVDPTEPLRDYSNRLDREMNDILADPETSEDEKLRRYLMVLRRFVLSKRYHLEVPVGGVLSTPQPPPLPPLKIEPFRMEIPKMESAIAQAKASLTTPKQMILKPRPILTPMEQVRKQLETADDDDDDGEEDFYEARGTAEKEQTSAQGKASASAKAAKVAALARMEAATAFAEAGRHFQMPTSYVDVAAVLAPLNSTYRMDANNLMDIIHAYEKSAKTHFYSRQSGALLDSKGRELRDSNIFLSLRHEVLKTESW